MLEKASELFKKGREESIKGNYLLAKQNRNNAQALLDKEFKPGLRFKGVFHRTGSYKFGLHCLDNIYFGFRGEGFGYDFSYTCRNNKNYYTSESIGLAFEKVEKGETFEAEIKLLPTYCLSKNYHLNYDDYYDEYRYRDSYFEFAVKILSLKPISSDSSDTEEKQKDDM